MLASVKGNEGVVRPLLASPPPFAGRRGGGGGRAGESVALTLGSPGGAEGADAPAGAGARAFLRGR